MYKINNCSHFQFSDFSFEFSFRLNKNYVNNRLLYKKCIYNDRIDLKVANKIKTIRTGIVDPYSFWDGALLWTMVQLEGIYSRTTITGNIIK